MTTYRMGRSNFAATIHVPTDCKNNCSFCTSKKLYQDVRPNIYKLFETCITIASSNIPEVVISGGEPTADIHILREILGFFEGTGKRVYINTTLPSYNFNDFASLVNTMKCVSGINISRHCLTLEGDRKMFNSIVPDSWLKDSFIAPVRINCVIGVESLTTAGIHTVAERWRGIVRQINFRANFNYVFEHNLHRLCDVPNGFFEFNLINHSSCEVCDTLTFQYSKDLSIVYHRGLRWTQCDSNVNDLIVWPDGKISLDWRYEDRFDLESPNINEWLLPYGSKVRPAKKFDAKDLRLGATTEARLVDKNNNTIASFTGPTELFLTKFHDSDVSIELGAPRCGSFESFQGRCGSQCDIPSDTTEWPTNLCGGRANSCG